MSYKVCAITTIDNPYDPIDDFDHWLMYDNSKGYGTCSLLARFANIDSDMSESLEYNELSYAIDSIIDLHSDGKTSFYKKIVRLLDEKDWIDQLEFKKE